ncbi:MAG: hypothetical protein KME03_20300 [Aphanocapsa lilacina HA4352-LM1]|nr:hypothetical protein [Aphanocapsa lilacina HA4352-LM1]
MYTYFKCGDLKFRTLEEALAYSVATGEDIQELTSKGDPFIERPPRSSRPVSWMLSDTWNAPSGYLSTPQDKLRVVEFDRNNIGKTKLRPQRPPRNPPSEGNSSPPPPN